ncbi:MAG: hypothetical protein WKH64_11470, partial [Chloroflexia bacterium]
MKVTDPAGRSTSKAFTNNVANVAPTATFDAPATVAFGAPFDISLTSPAGPSSTDQTAGFTYAFDCGLGSGYQEPTAENTATCTTADSPSQTISGKILDKNGGATEYTRTVSVTDYAPTGTVRINNGAEYARSVGVTLALSVTDPAPSDGVADMRFSHNGSVWTEWETYATSR